MKRNLGIPGGRVALRVGLLCLVVYVSGYSTHVRAEGAPSSAIRSQIEAAEVVFDPDGMCTQEVRLQESQAATAKAELLCFLAPLLYEEKDVGKRKRLALYLSGQALAEEAHQRVGRFDEIRASASSSPPERVVSALYDLQEQLLFTGRLRNARALMTFINFEPDGSPVLSLRDPPADSSVSDLVAPVVLAQLGKARVKGIDCSGSSLYAFVYAQSQAVTVPHYSIIRQEDLREFYVQIDGLRKSYLDRIRGAAAKGVAQADTSSVLALVDDTRKWYLKALEVLENALEMYGAALEMDLEGGLPEKRVASLTVTDPVETVSRTPAPAKSSSDAVDEVAPTVAPGEVARDAFVAEVRRQIESLRKQSGDEIGGMATRPTSVANNLLVRTKRLYKIAAMLSDSGSEDGQYACQLNEGALKIVFIQTGGDVSSFDTTVLEHFAGDTTLEWTFSLNRKSDRDFRLDSEFDGVKAYMEVSGAELVRFPNYHQLLVLMNRLDSLVNSNSGN